MRKWLEISINDLSSVRSQLVRYAAGCSSAALLDSNASAGSEIDLLAAFGSKESITDPEDPFEGLSRFHTSQQDWLFGFLAYDLKNRVENLTSQHPDRSGFPLLHFFVPEFILKVSGNRLSIGIDEKDFSDMKAKSLWQSICSRRDPAGSEPDTGTMQQRMDRTAYLQNVSRIKEHIRRGDIYEANFCMEFYSENAKIDPAEVFLSVNEISRSPFSAFFKLGSRYILSASPERFLKKSGRELISQPIKGTAPRGADPREDEMLKAQLQNNPKDRSENIMIVDLVRNDLSRVCSNVKVSELCKVHTFPKWHQMISTVKGELRDDVHFTDAIRQCFPMGSMTGAPKIRAMELIDQYENARRGVYSGAIGYITPEGDLDLNVVIRSILYNEKSGYLSFQAGSAITAGSVPEKEYEECLLKAKGMMEALRASEAILSR